MEFWYKITDRDIVDSVPHIVYDMSICDIQQRRLKALVFDNVVEASGFLGVNVETIFRNRKPKKYIIGLDKKKIRSKVIVNYFTK
jgi:hypothetical protein